MGVRTFTFAQKLGPSVIVIPAKTFDEACEILAEMVKYPLAYRCDNSEGEEI